MIANTYTDDMHNKCMMWAKWLTDSKRSLEHRAALARLIHDVWPEYSHQVGMLVQIKSLIQIQNEHGK